MTEFRHFLEAEVKRILPHMEDTATMTDLIDYLIFKGCKKERDLRIMTVPLLETQLDLVDASELYAEWQEKYGKILKYCIFFIFTCHMGLEHNLFL